MALPIPPEMLIGPAMDALNGQSKEGGSGEGGVTGLLNKAGMMSPMQILESGAAIFTMWAEDKSRRENQRRYNEMMIDKGNSDFKFQNSANTDQNPFGDFDLNNVLGGNTDGSLGFYEAGMRYDKGGAVKDGFLELDLTESQIEKLKAKGLSVEIL